MPKPSASILLHPTVTSQDINRLVEALRENNRLREEELREKRADNALRRYTLEELAELTKVPEARIRRIVATFTHIQVIGGKKGRGHKPSVSRADALWLVERMGKGGLDELMEAEERKHHGDTSGAELVKTG